MTKTIKPILVAGITLNKYSKGTIYCWPTNLPTPSPAPNSKHSTFLESQHSQGQSNFREGHGVLQGRSCNRNTC